MPVITPVVPTSIVVHLGSPNSFAQNVTVPFADYIKNVASSEIYPTWNENALRANILAQISFALNRVYTEFYRAQGKDFDITNDTAIDQKFIYGRNIFQNVGRIVDEIFNDYIRRQGYVEPLAAKYCNGTTVTCEGMSQWGSEYMARDGFSYLDILYSYYGYDIEIVVDAPVQYVTESYPGYPLSTGSTGRDVVVIQTSLNRISNDYPQIHKVAVDGIFGSATDRSVRAFQRIFNLTPDGIVGRATWYKLVRIYTGLLRLSELNSYGQTLYGFGVPYYNTFAENKVKTLVVFTENQKLVNQNIGSTIDPNNQAEVFLLQYFLNYVATFNPLIMGVNSTGVYDNQTKDSVMSFQKFFGLEVTGETDEVTWNLIYDNFAGIQSKIFTTTRAVDIKIVPFTRDLSLGMQGEDVFFLQEELNFIYVVYGTTNAVTTSGTFTEATKDSVEKFQENEGLEVTGEVDEETYKRLLIVYMDAVSSLYTSKTQFKNNLNLGDTDTMFGVKNKGEKV